MAEEYGFDSQAMRAYFEYERVKKGVLDITARMFGIGYRKVDDAPVWHPEVDAYDVVERRRRALLGRIYLDMHPREGKYKHDAQFTLVNGVARARSSPRACSCATSRGPTGGEPALMEHGDGAHLLPRVRPPLAPRARRPHALGRAVGRGDRVGLRRGAVADARGVDLGPRDAADVRAPLADRRAAAGGAGARARAPPTSTARALWVRQQMFYAATSLEFHARDPRGLDTTQADGRAAGSLHAVQVRRGHVLPRERSATSMATRRSTTRICGRS